MTACSGTCIFLKRNKDVRIERPEFWLNLILLIHFFFFELLRGSMLTFVTYPLLVLIAATPEMPAPFSAARFREHAGIR